MAKSTYNRFGKPFIPFERQKKTNKLTISFLFRAKTTVRADWQSEFRNNAMFHCIHMKRWYVIAPARAREETNNFIEALKRAGRGMQMEIGNPRV